MEHTLAQRLKTARKEARLTQEQLAKLSGVSQTDISKIERGQIKSTSSVIPLATALGRDAVWLQTGEPAHQQTIRSGANVKPWSSQLGHVPILTKDQAGMYKETIDSGDALPTVQTVSPVSRYTFAMQVEGDSMEPAFTAGAVVVVEPEVIAKPGDYVVAVVNNEVTLKQLVGDAGEWFLRPANQRYPIKPLGNGVILGKVVSSHMTY
jgi:SOS-response transcriptional repressor LexA